MSLEQRDDIDWLRLAGSVLAWVLFCVLVAILGLGALGQLFASRYLSAFLWTGALSILAAGFYGWRSRSRPWRVVLLLAVLCAVLPAGWIAFWSLGTARHELEAEGDALVAALGRYHEEHGRYPDSLAEAGGTPRWNTFGGWQYEPWEGHASYRLSVGDYDEDGFILYRDAQDASWHWDT